MESTGRFTPELRRLTYHSYDTCRRCGTRMDKDTAALAGYYADGAPAYVGPCCETNLKECASHIYWAWHADRRCVPSQKLWRYIDLAKFMSLLEDRALYFARVDKLGDPFEGAAGITARYVVWEERTKDYFRRAMQTLPEGSSQLSQEEIEKSAERLLGEMHQAMEYERQRSFATCWHANTVESEALWRLYCPPPQAGVLIQTTAEALEASLGPDAAAQIGHVQYLDFKTAFAGPYERIFTKRKSLSHEAEVRAVFERMPMKDPPTGILMPVDLKQLVHAIVPSPFAPPWLQELIAKTLKRHGLDLPLQASELLAEPFF
jgi:hypothetical protein